MTVSAQAIAEEFPGITHDLLNSLTSVHSLSEILRDFPGIDDRQRQRFVGMILSETQRLIGMVDDLPEPPETWATISENG